MDKFQCSRAGCGHVWDCEAQLRAIDAASVDGALTDPSVGVFCTKCGSRDVMPSLRGGDWFQHSPYEATQKRLLAWLDDTVSCGLTVAVIEVGVGPNTPIVTRVPAAAFASAVSANGGKAVYVRVNPGQPEQPEPAGHNPVGDNVALHRWATGWRGVKPVIDEATALRRGDGSAGTPRTAANPAATIAETKRRRVAADPAAAKKHQARYTAILESLRTPHGR